MRLVRVAIAGALFAWGGAAQATVVVIMVEPMTMQKYTRVFDAPGPDHVLMCMAPPSTSGCTEVPLRKRR